MKSAGLLSRARTVIKKDGYAGFLRKAFMFPLRRMFRYRAFYIYEHDTREGNEADYLPRIKDFTFRIVTTNQQAEEMAAAGLNIYSEVKAARNRLDQGAIGFCVFVGNKLAHIGWLGLDEKAKNSFDAYPYAVDFPREGCTGGTLTIPEFRGKGLMGYGYYKRFEYLRQKGINHSRNIVRTSNIASQKAHEKFAHRKSRGYFLKIGPWRFWREAKLRV
jgi:hypothetical protein